MSKERIVLDRLTAWVEKQSSVGPAAFKGMREEIEREVAREIPLEQIPQQGDQAEAEYRLRVVKSWLGSFPELRDAITEHMATELQAKVTPLIESTMEEVVDKAFEMPTIDEAFEGLKVACAKFPEFKRRIQLWLVDQSIEGVVGQLAKEMGEFARDEMGATASDVDEAIARDKAREMEETRAPLRYPLDSPEARAILEPSSEALGPGALPGFRWRL